MKKLLTRVLTLITLTVTMLIIFSLYASATECAHNYIQEQTPATLIEDGHISMKCEICGYALEDRTIPKIATVELKQNEFTFDGTEKRIELIALDSEGDPIDPNYYIFRWNYKRKIGTYTCSVEFFDCYNGAVTLSYKIVSPVNTPKLKAATSTSKGAKLEWEKQKAATGYIVYRKSGDGSWKKLGSTKKTYYVDPTAVYNKTYKYTVKAYYKPKAGSNITSSYNKKGLSLKMTHIVTPSYPTVSSKSLYASIKIKEVKGATSYKIYKATSENGKYQLIHTTKKGVLTYTDKSVKLNKAYYYKVKACVGSKASALSDARKVLIKLDTPKINSTVNVTSTTVTFKWSEVKGADYYTVYHRSNVREDWKKIKTVKAGSTLTYKGKFPARINQFSIVAFRKLSSKTTLKSSRSAILGANPIAKPKLTMNYPCATDLKLSLLVDISSNSDRYIVYCKQGKNGSWKAVKNTFDNSDSFSHPLYYHDVKLDTPYYFAVRSYYEYDSFKIVSQLSDAAYAMLSYNPKVEIVLPKESVKAGAFFPITFKNNSSSTLRLYPEAYVENENFVKSGTITAFDPYGEFKNENGYIDIAPGSSVTVTFGPQTNIYGSFSRYNRKASVIFRFRHNGADYYSSYSDYYGEAFRLNKE